MKLKTVTMSTMSATFALLATTALSQTTRDDVIQMLSNEGFTRIETSNTLFGNTKFEAYGPLGEREIVLGKDGAILRDHSEDSDDENSSTTTSRDDESDDDETDNSSDDERDDTSSSSEDTSDESDDADDDESDSSSDDENDVDD